LCRASTSFAALGIKDVDGRDKPGHDAILVGFLDYKQLDLRRDAATVSLP
jgi:hypothetical protein